MSAPTVLTRRSLLPLTLVLAAAAAAGSLRWLAPAGRQASLRLSGLASVSVPDDFIGLGYEMSSAAQIGLLSAENTKYLQLVRNLSAHGVLRFGGVTRDFTRYAPNGPVRADPRDN